MLPVTARQLATPLAIVTCAALLGMPAASTLGRPVSAGSVRDAGSCPDLYIVGLRGSGEKADARQSSMGPTIFHMAQRLRARFEADDETVTLVGVEYPALGVETLQPSTRELALLPAQPEAAFGLWYRHNFKKYLGSITDGVDAAHEAIVRATTACPDSDLVLAGYSQGAMAIHQAESRLRDEQAQDALDAIVGTLLLGDGDRVPNTAAHRVGSSAKRGEGVRTYAHGNARADVVDPELTAEICDANDIVCDFNVSRLLHFKRFSAVHTGYLRRATAIDQAVDWLAGELLSDARVTRATGCCRFARARAHTPGGSGLVTPGGRVGPLRLDASDRAAIVAFAGEPAAESSDTSPSGSAYDALGYDCSRTDSPHGAARYLVGANSYCRTVFFINQSEVSLATFFTSSTRYRTVRGIRVGTATRRVERRLHRRVLAGCAEGAYLSSPAARLTIGVRGGHTRQEHHGENTVLHVVGGRVYALALHSTTQDLGVFDCL